MTGRRRWPLLLGAVVLATLLRFAGLDGESLWHDELWSWHTSSAGDLATMITERMAYDNQPPGYYALLHLVQRVLGQSEPALRLPSAMQGILVVPALYVLGRRLLDPEAGMLAAWLAAVAYVPVAFSQEARAYAGLLLFTTLTAYFWTGLVDDLRTGRGLRVWPVAGYAVTGILVSYLHYYGVFVVALQLAAGCGYLALRHGIGPALRLALLAGPVAVAYLPWLPFLAEQLGRSRGSTAWIEPERALFFPRFLFNGGGPVDSGDLVLLALGPLYAGLAGWVALRLMRRATVPDGGALALLAAWIGVPFAVAMTTSLVWAPTLTNRNMIIVLPAALLLLAYAALRLPPARLRVPVAAGVVVVLLGHLLVLRGYYWQPEKEQWREAVALVAEHRADYPEAQLVVTGVQPHHLTYYLERNGLEESVDAAGPGAVEVLRQQGLAPAVWFLEGRIAEGSPVLAALEAAGEPRLERRLTGVTVWLFEIEP